MRKLGCVFGLALAMLGVLPCAGQDERFDILRFQVDGNTLLPAAEVQGLLAPLTGRGRVYGDIQKALEALEQAYRKRGYSTVQVFVPEQELTTGVVRLQVTEGVIGKVNVIGNSRFSTANIRAGLRALREGTVPNLRELSEGIQLSNENPAKQVDVTLGVSEEEGKVDAKVTVTEEPIQRTFVTLDNTGTAATGRLRTGIAYQNANLFDRDHTLTLAYTTSPDSPSGVRIDIFSIGYRVPLYGIGDSLDFIYGKSSANTPSSSPTLGGALGITSKGDVFGMRWNHHFPRQGEYSSKLIYGLDYKYIDARCTTDTNPVSIEPPTPPISSCVPYTTRPLSIAYVGGRLSPGQAYDYNASLAKNWPTGSRYVNVNGAEDRYSYLTPGNRPTREDFTILRLSGSLLKAFASDWQVRIAASGQMTANPLVSAEQFGLAGSNAVRGFNERATAADRGFFVNNELYAPELSKWAGLAGNLRVLAFYDFARGYNNDTVAGSVVPTTIGIASVGAGLRYSAGKNLSLRTDFALVTHAFQPNTQTRGERRAHISLVLGL